MKWNVVYRKDANGVWHAVAFFLVHVDGEDYAKVRNQWEPGHYHTSLETFDSFPNVPKDIF